MKYLLALAITTLASLSYAQSFLVLNNGVVITTDTKGFAYDFGRFILPYNVTMSSGQILLEDDKLRTVDSQGFLYEKDQKFKKIKVKGHNYLMEDSTLFTIDAQGFFYKFEKDAALKKVAKTGGNFFTVNTDEKKKVVDLYTVNNTGNYFKVSLPELNPADINVLGGSFFLTTQNAVFTVSKAGFVFSKPEIKVTGIKKSGGNYFLDSNNLFYTVSEEGILTLAILPITMKVDNLTGFGANYVLDNDGRLFVIDGLGNIAERTVNNHDLRNAKILSL